MHVVLQTSQEFSGHSLHGQYGDNVEEMDWGVGEVLRALERLNQLDNTFVYLTSDNGGSTLEDGPGGGCHGGYNGIFRGRKILKLFTMPLVIKQHTKELICQDEFNYFNKFL